MHIKGLVRNVLKAEDEVYKERILDKFPPEDFTRQEWIDLIYDKMMENKK